ncbi:MAG: biotin transporter BioY [Caldisericota bacterium]|nr:biotin transporter BioY [Caldisericota bacterium]
MKTRDITYTAIFTALTIVGAQIAIPIGQIPITLQIFFVLLSGLVLGARFGFLSQALYLFMGFMGLPVFAGFTGGVAYIYGPTGGYLIAFPIAAFLVGWISKKRSSTLFYSAASLAGIAVIYIFGWLRLGLFINDLKKAFIVGVAPFVLIDLIKTGVAVAAANKLKKTINF